MPHITLFTIAQKHLSCHADLNTLRRAEDDGSIRECAAIFILESIWEDLDYWPS